MYDKRPTSIAYQVLNTFTNSRHGRSWSLALVMEKVGSDKTQGLRVLGIFAAYRIHAFVGHIIQHLLLYKCWDDKDETDLVLNLKELTVNRESWVSKGTPKMRPDDIYDQRKYKML